MAAERPMGVVRSSHSSLWPLSLALVAAMVVLATTLFGLRQQRVEMAYKITRLHGQINRSRVELWDLQTRIMTLARPTRLREAIEARGLVLEPASGVDVSDRRLLATGPDHRSGSDDGRY